MRLRWIFMAVIFVALSGSVFFIYHRQRSLTKSPAFTMLYSKLTTWIAERRRHLVGTVATNNKQVTSTQNDIEPQIHFEFYTALPNMQIAGSDLVAKKNHNTEVNHTTKFEDEEELE